ncbi:hypothetical protein FHG87_023146, partial [Trinorchestia longiramus]
MVKAVLNYKVRIERMENKRWVKPGVPKLFVIKYHLE